MTTAPGSDGWPSAVKRVEISRPLLAASGELTTAALARIAAEHPWFAELDAENRSWIDPWMERWHPEEFPSSFQKLEWNAQGEERDIDRFVLQVRASGIRVKRPKTSPSLIAFTQTQVPILGAHLTGVRRYMTPQECAKLQPQG